MKMDIWIFNKEVPILGRYPPQLQCISHLLHLLLSLQASHLSSLHDHQSPSPVSILTNLCNNLTINDLFSSTIVVRQPDISPAPSFCPSGNFQTSETVLRENVSPSNGMCSSSNHSPEWRRTPKKSGRCYAKLSFARRSASVSSSSRLRSYDVYIGFHGRKPSLRRFANWLRAELELQGISCFTADRVRCRNSRSHETVQRVKNASSFGAVILTKKSFGNPYTNEELQSFFGRKNLCPIFFDLGAGDCLARDIIERRGELWERHGGELWMHYDGQEKEWREAVDGLSRLLDSQLEAYDGNWRDCIANAVILLATR